MELRHIGKGYHNIFCSMANGSVTSDYEIPEEVKAQMLEDFPEEFEIAEEGAVAEFTAPVEEAPVEEAPVEAKKGKK